MSDRVLPMDDEDDLGYPTDAGPSQQGGSYAPVETFKVRHSRDRGRWGGWIPWVLGVLVVVVLVAGLGTYWVRRQINPGSPGAPVAVSIPANSSTASIASILGKAGVIRDPTVFRLYVKAEGAGSLLPGKYKLPTTSSYDSVITAPAKGPPIVMLPEVHHPWRKFTPGPDLGPDRGPARGDHRRRSCAAALLPAARSTVPVHCRPGLPTWRVVVPRHLPGAGADDSDLSILQMMASTFDDNASTLGLDAAATKLGARTPYQIVVVASMVEREAANWTTTGGSIASV